MGETSSDAPPAETENRLILANRVIGTPVFSQAGQRMGHVDDLSIERSSGRVVYAVLSFGGFLGIGEKFHPLPWGMLAYDPEQAAYVVALDKAALASAPHYDRHELAELGGPRHRVHGERIFDYYGPYGSIPYW